MRPAFEIFFRWTWQYRRIYDSFKYLWCSFFTKNVKDEEHDKATNSPLTQV